METWPQLGLTQRDGSGPGSGHGVPSSRGCPQERGDRVPVTSKKADESQVFSTVTAEGAEHISSDVFVTVGSSSKLAQLC